MTVKPVPRSSISKTRQTLVNQQNELKVQKSKLHEAEAALAAITHTHAQTEAEYPAHALWRTGGGRAQGGGPCARCRQGQREDPPQVLTAPIDGVVQQLEVHTVGGVVTPAQALLAVAPSDSPIEVKAMVSNHDIGFVQAGQRAEIKVDTFNFTRYGLLHGKVVSVSQDSIVREKPQDKSRGTFGGDESSSEPPGQELSYAARISLDRTQMRVDDDLVNLIPGMAVTAEIKTGTRRIISYLFSPLLRYGHDSLRER